MFREVCRHACLRACTLNPIVPLQVLAVPLLAGSRLGDSRGIKPVTWLSAVGAIVGVSFLEQSGAAPGVGDLWSLLSALFFGIQARSHHPALTAAAGRLKSVDHVSSGALSLMGGWISAG